MFDHFRASTVAYFDAIDQNDDSKGWTEREQQPPFFHSDIQSVKRVRPTKT